MNPINNARSLACVTALVCGLAACGGGGDDATAGTNTGGGSTTPPAGGVPEGWKLVWADEFDVDGLPDASRWDYDTGRNQAGWYNEELQYYSRDRLENAAVSNGRLVITARKEDLSGMSDWGGQRYSSSRMLTRGKASWTYGFFEIRAKLPCGLGTWPAIWMLGTGGAWPGDGEIDIMEHVGKTPGQVLGTIHTELFNHMKGTQRGATTQVPDACNAFHNYQLHWTKDRIVIGVDNLNFFQFANPGNGYGGWPFDKPQFLLLNLAIGGMLGGPVDDAIFPVRMEVDYVRVYQPAS
jgi:beta-glucanase (GH16 family)